MRLQIVGRYAMDDPGLCLTAHAPFGVCGSAVERYLLPARPVTDASRIRLFARLQPSGLILPSRYSLGYSGIINPFLMAQFKRLHLEIRPVLPSLLRMLICGNSPPPLVRRTCPLKRGNYRARCLALLNYIHIYAWYVQISLATKPDRPILAYLVIEVAYNLNGYVTGEPAMMATRPLHHLWKSTWSRMNEEVSMILNKLT